MSLAKSLLKRLSRRGPLRVVKRIVISGEPVSSRLLVALKWSFLRTEDSNFYYPLTDQNRKHLAHFLSSVLGISHEYVLSLFAELEESEEFAQAISSFRSRYSGVSDSTFEPGRRLAWYVFVRALRPKLVLETGVHQGLGALVLSLALKRNSEEGHPGRYVGLDIDIRAGGLIQNSTGAPSFPFSKLVIGDAITSVNQLDEDIDLYISDSDHTEGYENAELLAVEQRLSDHAVVVSDNSHSSNVLLDWSENRGRPFAFFKEEPNRHWYLGAGIGVSQPPR